MTKENELAKQQLIQLQMIIGEILGKLSSQVKPWRAISPEELKMVDSLVALAKKVGEQIDGNSS